MSKGGGGGTSTTISDLPDYLKPTAERVLQRAETESQRPYQAYEGQRIADQNVDTLAGYQGIRDLNASGLSGITDSNDLYSGIGDRAADFANYNSGSVNTSFNPNEITAGMGTARQWDQSAADQYMSPYINNVIERQKQGSILDWQRSRIPMNDAAVSAGAFGGSRHGVAEYLGQEGLNRSLQDIEATGLNQAWNQAQGMFSSDRDADTAAQFGNIQNQLTAQEATEAGRQFGASFGQEGEALNEQFSQGAANIGIEGLAAQQAAAQGLASNQELGDRLGMERANAMATVGDEQQQYDQMGLDLSYSDFQNQRDQERHNLQFLNSIMAGVPVSGRGTVSEYTPQSTMSNLIGLGVGGLGAYNEFRDA
jgi:hypothetical protein